MILFYHVSIQKPSARINTSGVVSNWIILTMEVIVKNNAQVVCVNVLSVVKTIILSNPPIIPVMKMIEPK